MLRRNAEKEGKTYMKQTRTFRERSLIDISYKMMLREWGMPMISEVKRLWEQARTFRECSLTGISEQTAAPTNADSRKLESPEIRAFYTDSNL